MPATAVSAVKNQPEAASAPQSSSQTPTFGPTGGPSNALIQRARKSPASLSRQEVLQLQRTIGNQAVMRLLKTAPADPVTESVARTLAAPAANPGVVQRVYEAAATPEAAVLAANPVFEGKAFTIKENTTIYESPGSKTKVQKDQLKNKDIVIKNGESNDTKGRNWYKIKVYLKKGAKIDDQNLEGYIKADHTTPFFTYQAQKDVPLLTANTLPSPEHVKQGNIGDCYLMATMMTMAKEEPMSVVNMFSPSPYDAKATSHAVRFFDIQPIRGKTVLPASPVWVKVDKSFVAASFAADTWKAGQRYGESGSQLWPAMIEKAYAVYKNQKMRDIAGGGFIMANISKVMTEVTGKPQTMEEVGPDLEISGIVKLSNETQENFEKRKTRESKAIKKKNALRTIAIFKKGGMTFVGTGGEDKIRKSKGGSSAAGKGAAGESKIEGLASGHAYAVLGLEKEGNVLYVKVRNPWGEYGRGKYKDGNYSIVEGKEGAVSYIEFKDFLRSFSKLHHSLTDSVVNSTVEELEDSDFLDGVDVGADLSEDPPPPPAEDDDDEVPPPPPPEVDDEVPPPPPEED